MVLQKVKKARHFDRQGEIFILKYLVLLRFFPMVKIALFLVPMRRMGTRNNSFWN